MKFIATIVENLWGITLPVEQVRALVLHYGQAAMDAMLRATR